MRPGLFYACLLSCVLFLSGCGSALRELPPAGLQAHRTIAVFNDGFHSGILLPWPDPDLAFLDGRSDDKPGAMPWLEIGFGADAWARLGGGSCVGVRLTFSSSAGVYIMRHLPDRSPPPREEGGPQPWVWTFQVDQAGWTALVKHIHDGIDPDLNYPRRPGSTDWVTFGRGSWSVFNNCHDWTAGSLAQTGLYLPDHWLRSSGGFADDLAAAKAAIAAAGITVIGPPPAGAPPGPVSR